MGARPPNRRSDPINLNLKRYTEKAQEAVLAAQQLADRSGHPEIDPEHLLRALVDQQDGVVPSVLRQPAPA